MKNTLVVNLFGGPGTGKSTGAAYIFSKLKMLGVDAELVTEFAKDKVWEEDKEVFNNQTYILGKQSFRISRCYGKVDVIITDSPLALSAEYGKDLDEAEEIKALSMALHKKYNRVDIFLNRVKPYNPNGRNQTEDEAKDIDNNLKNLLRELCGGLYYTFNGDEDGYNHIIDLVYDLYKKNSKYNDCYQEV